MDRLGYDDLYILNDSVIKERKTIKPIQWNCDMKLAEKGDWPLVALASFPGSGNTWLRHLIEKYTGIYTGSYYSDGSLYSRGFKGELRPWEEGTTIVVKTHETETAHIQHFNAVILLIRNPFDAIISERHRQQGGGHRNYANKEAFVGEDWRGMVRDYTNYWGNVTMQWLNSGLPVLVVHYDSLKHNYLEQMTRIADFLHVPTVDRHPECLVKDPDGLFKRKNNQDLFRRDPYETDMYIRIKKKIQSVNAILLDRGIRPVGQRDKHYIESQLLS
ncbi:sialate:O-sulfotransferase 2-like [Glandiceps talaboti]